MKIDNDKIVYEALMKVLQHPKYSYIAEAFKFHQDTLQKILPTLTKMQQHTLECYVHSLADVYVAALSVALEEKDKMGL